jgi:hypothetical protein
VGVHAPALDQGADRHRHRTDTNTVIDIVSDAVTDTDTDTDIVTAIFKDILTVTVSTALIFRYIRLRY